MVSGFGCRPTPPSPIAYVAALPCHGQGKPCPVIAKVGMGLARLGCKLTKVVCFLFFFLGGRGGGGGAV